MEKERLEKEYKYQKRGGGSEVGPSISCSGKKKKNEVTIAIEQNSKVQCYHRSRIYFKRGEGLGHLNQGTHMVCVILLKRLCRWADHTSLIQCRYQFHRLHQPLGYSFFK